MQKFIALLLVMLGAQIASAQDWYRGGGLVDVQIVNQRGQPFADYPIAPQSRSNEQRAYLEAVPGARYAVRVTNTSAQRVGLVIAVDGRNIVSGKKSKLRSSERMYVLGPYQSATYRGWRTGRDRINEFYFTNDRDSYAGAFGDYSAMGVVAVAAFRDRVAPPRYADQPIARGHSKRGDSELGSSRDSAQSGKSAPGTGFGDQRYAPSYHVSFDAQRQAASKTFIKYEWRESLCVMGIVRCHQRQNRFWPSEHAYRERGFAPHPPGYRSRTGQRSTTVRRYR